MKTIKDAVIELGGNFPVREKGFTVGDEVLLVQVAFSPEYPDDEIGSLHAGGAGCDCGIYKVVCTRTEFEAEAKRMCYINGYLWGKEYPTNGKRPDLADDVVVAFKDDTSRWDDTGDEPVCAWFWGKSKAFKITDPRYKPVSEISESNPLNPSVSKSLESKWFEAGELPPVGEEFELKPYWHKVKVVAHDNGNIVYWNFHDQKYDLRNFPHYFRPIKNDKEKTIEAVDSVIHNYQAGAEIRTEFLNVLYDAGMLVLPGTNCNTKA